MWNDKELGGRYTSLTIKKKEYVPTNSHYVIKGITREEKIREIRMVIDFLEAEIDDVGIFISNISEVMEEVDRLKEELRKLL